LRLRAERLPELRAAWAKKPELLAVRDEVLALSVPSLARPSPWEPSGGNEQAPTEAEIAESNEDLRNITDLVRRWNSRAKHRISLRHAGFMSFDALVFQASEPHYDAFLGWLDRCCAERFGLYLDY